MIVRSKYPLSGNLIDEDIAGYKYYSLPITPEPDLPFEIISP